MRMKKTMKKLITVILSIALAVSSMTGCGSAASSVGVIKGADDTSRNDTSKSDADTDKGDDRSKSSYVGPETDTVQWFNASYAILTDINGQDYNLFGGASANVVNEAMYQSMLDSSWGVTDRESADETLDWILDEGHRKDFVEDGEFFTGEPELEGLSKDEIINFLVENFEYTEEDAQYIGMVCEMYTEYGEHAIDAWDYCRALSLMSFYYMAGYYTKEEALDKSLEIAETLQPMFTSWDELVDSYLRGYEYWAEEDSSERREIYEDLLEADDNPFRVDYNITLEKTW